MGRTVIVLVFLVYSTFVVQARVIWERHQDPVNYVPRLGLCPQGPPGKAIDCGADCRADQDCPEGYKCCPTACGRTCRPPIHRNTVRENTGKKRSPYRDVN